MDFFHCTTCTTYTTTYITHCRNHPFRDVYSCHFQQVPPFDNWVTLFENLVTLFEKIPYGIFGEAISLRQCVVPHTIDNSASSASSASKKR